MCGCQKARAYLSTVCVVLVRGNENANDNTFARAKSNPCDKVIFGSEIPSLVHLVSCHRFRKLLWVIRKIFNPGEKGPLRT